ncbi:MAG: transposase [Elusimicrobia bacterium]|nr:transposase [Elusimicrobiota bacterium]
MDAPGLLHHAMARGIERCVIFPRKFDYGDFVERLEAGLEKSPNTILAWALMPNHFHLLVRSGGSGISTLMRRVASTGVVRNEFPIL